MWPSGVLKNENGRVVRLNSDLQFVPTLKPAGVVSGVYHAKSFLVNIRITLSIERVAVINLRETAILGSRAHNRRLDDGPSPASQEIHGANGDANQKRDQDVEGKATHGLRVYQTRR